MKVRVLLFAAARDAAGTGSIELDLPEAAVVADVKTELAARFPQLDRLIGKLHVAVGSEYADDGTPVDGTAEVACFPPVSGG